MPDISLTNEAITQLNKFLHVSDKEFNTLSSKINEIPINLNPDEMASKLNEITPDHAIFLVDLYNTFSDFDLSTSDFIQIIREIYEQNISTENDRINIEDFKRRFDVLLGIGNKLRLWFKAQRLADEHERLFEEARILTDIRPVFGTNTSEDLIGAITTHQLKLTFTTSSGESQSIFLSLRNEHLLEMKRVVERALNKQKALESYLDKSKTDHL